jgi:hypothetical protein
MSISVLDDRRRIRVGVGRRCRRRAPGGRRLSLAVRYQGDAWEDPIRRYLENDIEWNENGYGDRKAYFKPRKRTLTDTSVSEVLEHALGIEKGRWSQIDQNRVARCLVSMGFTRHKVRQDGVREWRYRLDQAAPGRGGPSGPSR